MPRRQSKWDELQMDMRLDMVSEWCSQGATDQDIAKQLGIGPTTLYKWKKEHPEVVEALKKGKEIADSRVENALFKRATGYKYDEVTYEMEVDSETGESKKVERKRVTKEMPPDVTAMIYWLKNRKPDVWRDRRIPDVDEAGRGNLDKLVEVIRTGVEGLRQA